MRSATDARTWVATGQRNLAKARVESCHSEPGVCGHLRMRARHQSRPPDAVHPMRTGCGRTIVLMRMSIASSLMTTATFLRRCKHSAQLSDRPERGVARVPIRRRAQVHKSIHILVHHLVVLHTHPGLMRDKGRVLGRWGLTLSSAKK